MIRTLFTAAVLAAFSCPAAAQMQCGPAPIVDASLRSDHGEAPAEIGMTEAGPVVLYRGAETWTLVLMLPERGIACLLAAGRDWQPMPAAPTDPKPEEIPS